MTDLAVRAILAIAAREGRVPGAALAAELETSTALLPQVLAPIVRAGWVTSTSGPGGGYQLSADLVDVSLLDVIETVEGPTETGRCVLAGHECPSPTPCALHEAWSSARNSLLKHLRATALASLDSAQTAAGSHHDTPPAGGQ